MQILIAVDGSSYSLGAVDEVARRPWPAGSAAKIVSVVKLPFVPTAETRSLPESEYSQLEQAMRAQANAAANQAAERLRAGQAALTVSTEVLTGHPVEQILDQAEQLGAELIVLGSRGLGGFKSFLLGSVSQAVLQQAHCSVLIVRPAEQS